MSPEIYKTVGWIIYVILGAIYLGASWGSITIRRKEKGQPEYGGGMFIFTVIMVLPLWWFWLAVDIGVILSNKMKA